MFLVDANQHLRTRHEEVGERSDDYGELYDRVVRHEDAHDHGKREEGETGYHSECKRVAYDLAFIRALLRDHLRGRQRKSKVCKGACYREESNRERELSVTVSTE